MGRKRQGVAGVGNQRRVTASIRTQTVVMCVFSKGQKQAQFTG